MFEPRAKKRSGLSIHYNLSQLFFLEVRGAGPFTTEYSHTTFTAYIYFFVFVKAKEGTRLYSAVLHDISFKDLSVSSPNAWCGILS